MEYVRVPRDANFCKSVMFTLEQKVYCLLSMTINKNPCLQSPSSPTASMIFHIKSWLLMSKSFSQQLFPGSQFHHQPPPSTFQTGMARGSDTRGSWADGDSLRTRCHGRAGGPHIFSLKHTGSRSGLWCSTAPFTVLELHPKNSKPSHHSSQNCEVLNFLKQRGAIQTFCSMGLLNAGCLMGSGGSWVPSCNLDVGRVPAWQLRAVHDLNSSRCPPSRSSKPPQFSNEPQAAAGAGGKSWSSTAQHRSVSPSSLQIIFLWAEALAEAEERAQPQVGLMSLSHLIHVRLLLQSGNGN